MVFGIGADWPGTNVIDIRPELRLIKLPKSSNKSTNIIK